MHVEVPALPWKGLDCFGVGLEAYEMFLGQHQVLPLFSEHGAARLHFAMLQDLAIPHVLAQVFSESSRDARGGCGEWLIVVCRESVATDGAEDGTCALETAARAIRSG